MLDYQRLRAYPLNSISPLTLCCKTGLQTGQGRQTVFPLSPGTLFGGRRGSFHWVTRSRAGRLRTDDALPCTVALDELENAFVLHQSFFRFPSLFSLDFQPAKLIARVEALFLGKRGLFL